MDSEAKKSFVISLPQIRWRRFLEFQFLITLLVITLIVGFAYWWISIRPYFWISNARVAAFSALYSNDIAGRIVEMGPDVGEEVKKGDLLFALDAEVTQAMQKRLQHTIHVLDEQISMEKLRLEKAMQDYVAASSEMEMGLEISDTLRKHLATIEDAQSKSEKATRELQAINTELSILELQEKKMRWNSPFDGIVLNRSAHVGSVVPFGHPVYTVYDPKKVWIEADVPETQIEHSTIGSMVRIRFPSYPKKEWKGKITAVGPSAHKGFLKVKISLNDKKFFLKPGLSAEVALKVH